MKMYKVVVMVNGDVQQDNVFSESERILVRELNNKYGKENVLKVIDITDRDVLQGMSKEEFTKKFTDCIENIEFLSVQAKAFIIKAITDTLE